MKKRLRKFTSNKRHAVARMPVWVTDGINRAVGEPTFDSAEAAARACILALATRTATQINVNTIGKYIAFIRMACLQDDKAGKTGNGHETLWALAVECAAIYRDALDMVLLGKNAGLDQDDITMLEVFVNVAHEFMRRHTEHEIAVAWQLLDTPNTLQLLLGIDPETGEYNADAGKMEQWLSERAAA